MSENTEVKGPSALITFKTIAQDVFKINLPLSSTVVDIKDQISKSKGGGYEASRLKLIYNGKTLEDSETLGKINVEAKKYIVVMILKKKIEPPIVSQITPSSFITPKSSSNVATPNVPSNVAIPGANFQTPLVTGLSVTPEQEAAITTICGMGYQREQALTALRAAFWDTQRAIEYLCTGPRPPRNVQQGPDFTQVLQRMSDRAEAVNHENEVEEVQNLAEGNAEPSHQIGYADVPADENDQRAIRRIQAMGFEEQLVIEAYFACDKNEDLAINYILSRTEGAYR